MHAEFSCSWVPPDRSNFSGDFDASVSVLIDELIGEKQGNWRTLVCSEKLQLSFRPFNFFMKVPLPESFNDSCWVRILLHAPDSLQECYAFCDILAGEIRAFMKDPNPENKISFDAGDGLITISVSEARTPAPSKNPDSDIGGNNVVEVQGESKIMMSTPQESKTLASDRLDAPHGHGETAKVVSFDATSNSTLSGANRNVLNEKVMDTVVSSPRDAISHDLGNAASQPNIPLVPEVSIAVPKLEQTPNLQPPEAAVPPTKLPIDLFPPPVPSARPPILSDLRRSVPKEASFSLIPPAEVEARARAEEERRFKDREESIINVLTLCNEAIDVGSDSDDGQEMEDSGTLIDESLEELSTLFSPDVIKRINRIDRQLGSVFLEAHKRMVNTAVQSAKADVLQTIDDSEKELEQLRQENKVFRETIAQLSSENAKLREDITALHTLVEQKDRPQENESGQFDLPSGPDALLLQKNEEIVSLEAKLGELNIRIQDYTEAHAGWKQGAGEAWKLLKSILNEEDREEVVRLAGNTYPAGISPVDESNSEVRTSANSLSLLLHGLAVVKKYVQTKFVPKNVLLEGMQNTVENVSTMQKKLSDELVELEEKYKTAQGQIAECTTKITSLEKTISSERKKRLKGEERSAMIIENLKKKVNSRGEKLQKMKDNFIKVKTQVRLLEATSVPTTMTMQKMMETVDRLKHERDDRDKYIKDVRDYATKKIVELEVVKNELGQKSRSLEHAEREIASLSNTLTNMEKVLKEHQERAVELDAIVEDTRKKHDAAEARAASAQDTIVELKKSLRVHSLRVHLLSLLLRDSYNALTLWMTSAENICHEVSQLFKYFTEFDKKIKATTVAFDQSACDEGNTRLISENKACFAKISGFSDEILISYLPFVVDLEALGDAGVTFKQLKDEIQTEKANNMIRLMSKFHVLPLGVKHDVCCGTLVSAIRAMEKAVKTYIARGQETTLQVLQEREQETIATMNDLRNKNAAMQTQTLDLKQDVETLRTQLVLTESTVRNRDNLVNDWEQYANQCEALIHGNEELLQQWHSLLGTRDPKEYIDRIQKEQRFFVNSASHMNALPVPNSGNFPPVTYVSEEQLLNANAGRNVRLGFYPQGHSPQAHFFHHSERNSEPLQKPQSLSSAQKLSQVDMYNAMQKLRSKHHEEMYQHQVELGKQDNAFREGQYSNSGESPHQQRLAIEAERTPNIVEPPKVPPNHMSASDSKPSNERLNTYNQQEYGQYVRSSVQQDANLTIHPPS